MPLHLSKIAFGCPSLPYLAERLALRGRENGGVARLTTRYRPKRAAEMTGGSLYWIIAHHIVARSPLVGFEPSEDGKTHIIVAAEAIAVRPHPRRAHQGWRYLADDAVPPDLASGAISGDDLPLALAGELSALGLI